MDTPHLPRATSEFIAACNEVVITERTYLAEIQEQIDSLRGQVSANTLQPFETISSTTKLASLNIADTLEVGNYDTAVTQLCSTLNQHLAQIAQPMTNVVINVGSNTSVLVEAFDKLIKRTKDAVILQKLIDFKSRGMQIKPIQRGPRYEILMLAVMKEALHNISEEDFKKLEELGVAADLASLGFHKPDNFIDPPSRVSPASFVALVSTVKAAKSANIKFNQTVRIDDSLKDKSHRKILEMFSEPKYTGFIAAMTKKADAMDKIAEVVMYKTPKQIAEVLSKQLNELLAQQLEGASKEKKQEVFLIFKETLTQWKEAFKIDIEIPDISEANSDAIVREMSNKMAVIMRQDFYYSQIANPDIREKIRGVMHDGNGDPRGLHATKSKLLHQSSTMYYIKKLNDDYVKFFKDIKNPNKLVEAIATIEHAERQLTKLGLTPQQAQEACKDMRGAITKVIVEQATSTTNQAYMKALSSCIGRGANKEEMERYLVEVEKHMTSLGIGNEYGVAKSAIMEEVHKQQLIYQKDRMPTQQAGIATLAKASSTQKSKVAPAIPARVSVQKSWQQHSPIPIPKPSPPTPPPRPGVKRTVEDTIAPKTSHM